MSEQPNATHKLICYYNDPAGQPGAQGPASEVEWELFDLIADQEAVGDTPLQ